MFKMHKAAIRDTVVCCVVAGASAAAIIIMVAHSGPDAPKPSEKGLRGFWTASQQAAAQRMLTLAPVSESPVLAACVVAQVMQQNDYAQFQQYARMAATSNFNNPNSDQASVINNLMFDALTCPE